MGFARDPHDEKRRVDAQARRFPLSQGDNSQGGSETNEATLSMRWLGGGRVEFTDGKEHSFRASGIRKFEWYLNVTGREPSR